MTEQESIAAPPATQPTGVMKIMGRQGDTKITWDKNNRDEVEMARKTFESWTNSASKGGKGYARTARELRDEYDREQLAGGQSAESIAAARAVFEEEQRLFEERQIAAALVGRRDDPVAVAGPSVHYAGPSA